MTIEPSYRQYMTTAITIGLTKSAPGVTKVEKIVIPRIAIRRDRSSRFEVTMPTFESSTRKIGNSITSPKARKSVVMNPK